MNGLIAIERVLEAGRCLKPGGARRAVGTAAVTATSCLHQITVDGISTLGRSRTVGPAEIAGLPLGASQFESNGTRSLRLKNASVDEMALRVWQY